MKSMGAGGRHRCRGAPAGGHRREACRGEEKRRERAIVEKAEAEVARKFEHSERIEKVAWENVVRDVEIAWGRRSERAELSVS